MKAARIQAGLTIALGFLIFAPSPMYYGAFALRWIALAILLLISLGPVFAHLKKTGAIRLDTLDLLGLAVCAWLALTVLWSTDTGAGIDALIHLALLVPFFWLIRYGPWPHDAHIPACVLAAAAIIVMGFDLVSPIHNGGYGNENFLTEFLIGAGAFIAVAGLALRHRGLLVVAALILADLIFVNPSKMEFPVLAVASVAVIFYLLPVRRTVKIGLLLALAVLAAGVVIVLAEPLLAHRSVYFRLPLQVSALLMWVDAPLFGHGLSSFNATFMQAPEAFRAVPFLADVPFNVQGRTMAGFAHNDILQLMAETGLVGLVLVTSFICTILIIRFREKTWSAMAKAALAVVVALLIVSMMEFPLQNAATVSLFVASLGILARGKQMGKVRTLSVSEGGTVSLDVLARMLVLALFLVSVVQYNAALVNGRRKALYNIDSAEAFVASDRAATLWPVMTHYRARLYPTYVNWLFKALQDGSAFRYPILYDIAYAEKLYKTSLAAMPDYPAIGLARVRWLVIQDQAKTHKDEIETILADLKARAASNSALWVTEAFYAWKIGQTDRANDAIAKGRALPYLPGWDRTHLSSIEKTIGEDRL